MTLREELLRGKFVELVKVFRSFGQKEKEHLSR